MTDLLQGFTATGSRIHAVEDRENAPKMRQALCGVLCATKHKTFEPEARGMCQLCARAATSRLTQA